MGQRSQFVFPSLSTHVANIALNKDIGLYFLLAEEQDIQGGATLSGETLLGDQLLVASAMLEAFLDNYISEKANPFVDMGWNPKDCLGLPNEAQLEKFKGILDDMRMGIDFFCWEFWSKSYSANSRSYLESLTLQADACAAYMRQRTNLMFDVAGRDPALFLLVKNSIPASRVFCYSVLEIAREALSTEAMNRGYRYTKS